MLFLIFILNAVTAVSQHNRDEFWSTIEIQSIDWKGECVAAQAVSPLFQIISEMKSDKERHTVGWPVFEDAQGKVIQSYWKGRPEDLMLSTQFFGKDVVYSFPRIVSKSNSKRPFYMEMNHDLFLDTPDLTAVTITFKGDCHNATLHVKINRNRCPWCPEEIPKFEKQLSPLEENYATIVYVLVGITVVSSTLTVVLGFLNCRNRNLFSSNSSTIASSFYSPARRTMITTAANSRIPTPPSFSSPSLPSTGSSRSTVVLKDDPPRDDSIYEEISTAEKSYFMGDLV